MNVYLSKFMMYYQMHKMHRDGQSISQISNYLVINRRTVKKYLKMNEREYEDFLVKQSERKKELQPYETFIKERLAEFQDTSSAQMYDWLKEHDIAFPKVTPKTVFNFVNWVRNKYNLPKVNAHRQCHPIEEMPYGKQAQVDFGEYNLRTSTGKRVKVFFFTIVLSRSRFKYVWFTDRYFTSELAIVAHEKSFEYFKGTPDEVVYDQDKVFVSDENKGDIILTDKFRAYTREMDFSLHFCRKADPQSKGKVENVVKYVKQNFLYNRTYYNIETLNDDAMGWLGRTANALPHSFTKKVPFSEWNLELPFLKPYKAHVHKVLPVSYSVRKDNTISYRSNLYSLPLGTYKGRGSIASVYIEQDRLTIFASDGTELCKHEIAVGQGIKIINTDHKRDKTSVINEMIEQISALLEDPEQGKQWMASIRIAKPRYIRDQLLLTKQIIDKNTDPSIITKALDYCIENKITSATDLREIVILYEQQEPERETARIIQLNPLGGTFPEGAMTKPEQSRIDDYRTILENKQKL